MTRPDTPAVHPAGCSGVSGDSVPTIRAGSLPENVQAFWCPRCRRVGLPAEAFYPSKRTWYGLRAWCIECELASKRQPPIPRRPCVVCGEEYQPVRQGQQYCSPRCRNRRPRPPRVRGVRPCAWCAAEFEWHPKMATTYCSQRCHHAARAARLRLGAER
jgi:endogenous inhibitor of DNA gyrase (YacG/DUF329 family)